jgi:hypothetical protein
MANLKVANKGGQGGRLGHSNMEHWTYTEEVKRAARKKRRRDAKNTVQAGLEDAGFGEETVFRGYMFERLGKLFGPGVWARTFIVLLTAGWFGLAHYPVQGLAGAEQATIVGLVFGTIFAVTGRIWMLMCAHAAFDLTALAIIYRNLESDVARFVFK